MIPRRLLAALVRALAVDGKTVASYLDLLVDLLLVRRLAPWHANVRKRLVKSPKVYVRDSGLVHALHGIGDREALLSHPVSGGSWEGLAIESLIAAAPSDTDAHVFGTPSPPARPGGVLRRAAILKQRPGLF